MSDEIAELKAELVELVATMKAGHLKMAKALVNGKSQEAAYVSAGYKGKNPNSDSNKLIADNPSISQYKNLVQKIAALELLPKQIATIEQKRNLLWDVAQRCVQEVEPEYEGYGEDREIVGYTFNARGAIGAVAELNKMDGHIATTKTAVDHTTAGQPLPPSSNLSPEQLTEIVRKVKDEY